MKLYFSKFLMAAAMIGAVALTGCSDGGGDSTTVVKGDYSGEISATNSAGVTLAKSLTAGLAAGSNAVTFTTSVPGEVTSTTTAGGTDTFSIPSGTSLVFKPVGATGTPIPTAVTDFTLTENGVDYNGYIIPGSCIFKFRAASGYRGHAQIKFSPCKMEVKTQNFGVGDHETDFVWTLGKVDLTVKIFVTVTADGKVKIKDVQFGKFDPATGITGLAS